MRAETAAIILAAGTASRFRAARGPDAPPTKLVALYQGKPLVRHVAEAACASAAHPVVVVTGHAEAIVCAALKALPLTFVRNGDYASGLASSLRTGIAALPAQAVAALILLGDMPRISAALLDRLMVARDAAPDALAIVPTYVGQRGNPVLIHRRLFPAIGDLSGDTGARALLRAAGDAVVEVAIEDAAVAFDVDTPDRLRDSI